VAEQYDMVLRVALAALGLVVAGHHLSAAAAMKRGPHLVKAFSLPLTAMSGVGMAFFAATSGSGSAVMMAAPMSLGMIVTEIMVWRAGAYISSAFEIQAAMQEKARHSLNRVINDSIVAAEYADILTDSGLMELESHGKSKVSH
jgi:hypothetical protein